MTTPCDDHSINNECMLWRRVPHGDKYIIFDENQNRYRPSSAAFEDHKNGSPMSVYVEGKGNTPGDIMIGHDRYCLASITVGLVRSRNQIVVMVAIQNFPSHAEVIGPKPHTTRSVFAKKSSWIIGPPTAI